MAENRWREVEKALGEALELPQSGRQSYLEQAGLTPEVRRRVEQLQAAWEDSEGFLESPALAVASSSGSPGMPPGTRLGPWRLVSIIGSGGMGTVYRAERDDQQFMQEAAVKVVAAGRMNRDMERRFRAERQILARLEHPQVARLIDGGVAPDGSPYLVMEFVDGVRIDAWCRERNLGARQRLRLFRQVCAAVHFAHQHLVVHCDLKPGNILITEDGAPKLLDFGIARLLTRDAEVTATLLHPMTPEYASPEQVSGSPLGAATDIYSLGIVLHELLTGSRPYQLSGKALDEVLEIVCQREPRKPQTGSADLDAIILKALRKDPAQRYGSAGDLAADIGRYLEARPVHAQPPRAGYVLRKFVARHRLAVTAAAAVAALLIAAGAMIVRESSIAARRFEDVRQLAGFVIFDMNDAITPLAGSTPARQMLVSHALQYLDSLARNASGDETLQRELALAYLRIGDVSGHPSQPNLGDSAEALRSYQKAASLLDPLFREHPRALDLGRNLALVYERMEAVHQHLRETDEALKAAEMALALNERIFRAAPNDSNRKDLAHAYSSRAHAGLDSGRPDLQQQALRDYLAAIGIYEDLLSKSPRDRELLRHVALGHKYAGGILSNGQHPYEALAHLHRAQELDEQRVRGDPSDRQAKLDLSFDYSQDADFQVKQLKDLPAALALYEKTLAIRQELSASDPKDVRLRDRLMYIDLTVSGILLDLKRPAEASVHAVRALRTGRELYAREGSPHYRAQLAWAHDAIGSIEAAGGRRTSACEAFRQAHDLLLEGQRSGKLNDWEQVLLADITKGLSACPR